MCQMFTILYVQWNAITLYDTAVHVNKKFYISQTNSTHIINIIVRWRPVPKKLGAKRV